MTDTINTDTSLQYNLKVEAVISYDNVFRYPPEYYIHQLLLSNSPLALHSNTGEFLGHVVITELK